MVQPWDLGMSCNEFTVDQIWRSGFERDLTSHATGMGVL